MTSRAREAVQHNADRQKARDGESVSYVRGATTATLTAVVGTTPFRQVDSAGRSTLTYSEADFLILADDMTTAGLSTPARGDRITWSGRTYEVNAPGGEPCFRNSDSFGIRYRIHTKKVA